MGPTPYSLGLPPVVLWLLESVPRVADAGLRTREEQLRHVVPCGQRFADAQIECALTLSPEIGSWTVDDYTSEELKLVNETRQIFHESNIAISATCVRVTTFVSHASAVFAEFTEPM